MSLAEFWLSVVVLGLSLVTMLTGVTGNHSDAPIATFNTSSLGLSAYHDPTSPFYDALVTLVPSNIVSPPSITQYLNAKDWYNMHYFSVCSGYYVPSSSNPSLLTSSKTNITCSRQSSGYNFSLQDTVLSTLRSEVKDLADGLTDRRWTTQSASSAWYTGISHVFLCVVVLSFTVAGKGGWWRETIVMSFISWVCFFVSSSLLTHRILAINHLSGDGIGPNPRPNEFLALTWCCAVVELVAFCLRWWEIRVQGRKCCKRTAEVEVGVERGIEINPGKEWEASSGGS